MKTMGRLGYFCNTGLADRATGYRHRGTNLSHGAKSSKEAIGNATNSLFDLERANPSRLIPVEQESGLWEVAAQAFRGIYPVETFSRLPTLLRCSTESGHPDDAAA